MIDPDKLYFSSTEYRDLLEEIGDEIEEEELAQRAGNSVEACNHGLIVWDNLLELMKMLKAKSLYEISSKGVTMYDLLYWADCLADELQNASIKDKSYIKKKLDFCEAYVEMHRGMLDKDVNNLGNIKISLAQTYYQMGEIEKTDSLFEEWLKLEPDWGWGWIGWSDSYWLRQDLGLENDFDKAEKILREGLSVPKVADRDIIEDRLNDLLKEKTQI